MKYHNNYGCWYQLSGFQQSALQGFHSWNALQEEITSVQSLTIFCQHLKTWLFRQS